MLLHHKPRPVCCSGMPCEQAGLGSLFGWACRACPGCSPAPGALVLPGARWQWELLPLSLCERRGADLFGLESDHLSHKASASPMSHASCFSPLSSCWSGSFFGMISIPWVFRSKALGRSFLPFVIPVLCVQSGPASAGDPGTNGKKPHKLCWAWWAHALCSLEIPLSSPVLLSCSLRCSLVQCPLGTDSPL